MWIIKDFDGHVLVRIPRVLHNARVVTIETSLIKNQATTVQYRFYYRRDDGARIEVRKDDQEGDQEWQRSSPDYPAHTKEVCKILIKLFRRSIRKLDPKVKFSIKVLQW